jgi:lipooligosaccharide transport system permease protein
MPTPTQDAIGPPTAWHLLDYWITVARRTWRGTVVSSFLTPVLYIVGMGVVLGGFIEGDPARLDGANSYLAFVAPGLLAAHAMTIAFGETTYPVLGMIKWHKTYYGMVATPLRVRDVVNSHLVYVLVHVALVCTVFLLVLLPFGVVQSWWGGLLVLPVLVLIGAAFAAPVFAFSATIGNESYYALIFRLLMIPLFLFSGAFFPLENLPAALEWIAKLTPLWHGVDLTRMLTVGNLDAAKALVHLTYLLALAVGGWWLSIRRLERRLIT